MINLTIIRRCVWLLLIVVSCNKANERTANKKDWMVKPNTMAQPNKAKPTSYTDTLFILDEFASQPFLLDSISITAVIQLFKPGQVTKKPVKNNFIQGQTDTVITIRKNRSYIQLYKVSSEENKCFYKAAIIRDTLYFFNQPLKIGQTKQQVKKALKSLSSQPSLPDIIQISNDTGTDYLYLIFRHNKLEVIKFLPYLD